MTLNRRVGEAIIIGGNVAGNITVRVIAVERNSARIRIDAPRDLPVDREEIAIKKQNEKPENPYALLPNVHPHHD